MSLDLLTPQAEDDLDDIWSYIAQDSLDPACDPLRIIRILHGARDIRRSLATLR